MESVDAASGSRSNERRAEAALLDGAFECASDVVADEQPVAEDFECLRNNGKSILSARKQELELEIGNAPDI